MKIYKKIFVSTIIILSSVFVAVVTVDASVTTTLVTKTKVATTIDTFEARPPIHILGGTKDAAPSGLTPTGVRAAYHLLAANNSNTGSGTIAIISAYHHASLENDLAAFSTAFSLPKCSTKNGCLEIHTMGKPTKIDSGWDLESDLDAQWAHAIAPSAKILVVEATSAAGSSLMKAVDYARSRADVVAVSMSWGGDEFDGETKLDSHFVPLNSAWQTSTSTMAFFASSGDDGTGASWPAVSPNVIAVGGTRLDMDTSSTEAQKGTPRFISEKAWSGSGGGVSTYEAEPTYQKNYSIPRASGKRAVPDVAYAADPATGFSVYHSGKWYVIGGTSAGAPQWAALQALNRNITLTRLYADKASSNSDGYFRDIKSGSNGDCGYYCQARAHYDYVTGLGSPVTVRF